MRLDCEEAFPAKGSALPVVFVYTRPTHRLEAVKNPVQVLAGNSGSTCEQPTLPGFPPADRADRERTGRAADNRKRSNLPMNSPGSCSGLGSTSGAWGEGPDECQVKPTLGAGPWTHWAMSVAETISFRQAWILFPPAFPPTLEALNLRGGAPPP